MFKDVRRRGNTKTIGLRISEETLAQVHKVSNKRLSDFESLYGLDLSEGSTLMRLAISHLLQNPPTKSSQESLIIACKDDDTFARFLKNIVGEIAAK